MEFGEGSISCRVAEQACSICSEEKISLLSSLSPFVGRIFSPTHVNEEEGEKTINMRCVWRKAGAFGKEEREVRS